MSGLDPHPGVKLTYDDLLLFPDDDGLRHELIDGAHVVSAAPNTKHQTVLLNLAFRIRLWLEDHAIGQLFVAPFDVVFSQFDVVEPDLLYVSKERASQVLTDKHLRGAPELVVEITSPTTSRRDQGIKKALYERMGVSEYWAVDPVQEKIQVYRRGANGFAVPFALSLDSGEVLTSPLLPGLELPLSRIF